MDDNQIETLKRIAALAVKAATEDREEREIRLTADEMNTPGVLLTRFDSETGQLVAAWFDPSQIAEIDSFAKDAQASYARELLKIEPEGRA